MKNTKQKKQIHGVNNEKVKNENVKNWIHYGTLKTKSGSQSLTAG